MSTLFERLRNTLGRQPAKHGPQRSGMTHERWMVVRRIGGARWRTFFAPGVKCPGNPKGKQTSTYNVGRNAAKRERAILRANLRTARVANIRGHDDPYAAAAKAARFSMPHAANAAARAVGKPAILAAPYGRA